MRNIITCLLLLIWLSGCHGTSSTSTEEAMRTLDLAKVQVVKIEGKELLYIPDVGFSGGMEKKINVRYRFYEYVNGELKLVPMTDGKQ